MPIPKPGNDEKDEDFIGRCMGDDVMNKDYPDSKQRAAVCYGQLKKKGENMEQKRDEKGRLIIAENVKLIIGASLEVDDNDRQNQY